MRCNQVSIFIERFGEYVPKDYPSDVQRISVYCDDSKSIYAALAKANAMAVNELNEYEPIGVRSYASTNEYSRADYKEMQGVEPKDRSNYDDDLELAFTYKAGDLRKDRIWIHENLDEVLKLIRSIENKRDIKIQLKEKFGLSDFQIRKLLSVRLDKLTKADYLDDIEEEKEYEAKKNGKHGWDPVQMMHFYEKQIREASKKIDEYRAYITITENYQDMIEIIIQNPEFASYANILRDKYGFDRSQAGLVKLMTVEDLLSTDKYRMEVEKLQEEIKKYREWMSENSETNGESKNEEKD